MSKLTKQEVFKTIKLINLGEYENSLLDFFEELDELILNVTDEEKDLIIKFVKNEISSWNNFSYENLEYDNLLYKNIVIYCDGQIDHQTSINIYETISDNEIRKVATLELLPDYND